MTGLTETDRGQRLSGRLPEPLRQAARRYSDWNFGWQADIALRYEPVATVWRAAGLLERSPLILDVGCGSKGGVTSYVPVRTVGIDLSFNEARVRRHPAVTPVVGSALALPVGSGSVDVALCMDTLEHLSPVQRIELAGELFRVVRNDGMVIAGAPCGLEARAAEEVVNRRYRARTGREHPWLVEHLMFDPLTPVSLAALMDQAAGQRFGAFDLQLWPNTSLRLWRRMQEQGLLRHVHRLAVRPWWPWLRRQHSPPVYRQVCVVTAA